MGLTLKFKRIFMPALSAALSTVMLLSLIMTVFAWTDFTQSRTNDFGGTAAAAAVILHKYEKNQKGDVIPKPVANAGFLLYRQDGDSWSQTGSLYITDANGEIKMNGMTAGNYKFTEQSPGYGYGYDKDASGNDIREYPFTVTENDAAAGTVPVTAYNRRLEGGLEITKTVKNADDSPLTQEQEGKQFEFTVSFSDGGTYQCTIDNVQLTITSGDKIYLKNGQKAVFTKMPAGLYYSVAETPDSNYIVSGAGSSGNIAAGKTSRADFTNTYGSEPPTPGKVRLTVHKEVKGEVPAGGQSRDFGFTLTDNGDPVHFTLKAGEEKTFEIDAGDAYAVTEDDPFPYGYIQEPVAGGAGTAASRNINVTVTNDYVATVTAVIQGEKTWDMNGYPNAVLPASITVRLTADGREIQSAAVRPDGEGRWLYSFVAPKYDGGGNEIKYAIDEEPVPGFIGRVSGNDIKNTWIGTAVANPAKVRKIITGKKPASADTFLFELEPQNGAPMPEGTINNIKTVSITGEGEADFGNIRYANAGVFIYQISEVNGGAGCVYDGSVFTVSVTVSESGGKLAVQSVGYSKAGGNGGYTQAVFTNEYKGATDKPDDRTAAQTEPSAASSATGGATTGRAYPGDSPGTGDASDLLMWAFILICSSFALVSILTINRKKRYVEKSYQYDTKVCRDYTVTTRRIKK